MTARFVKVTLAQSRRGKTKDDNYRKKHDSHRAELQQEGILFRTQFPSLGIFITKIVGF